MRGRFVVVLFVAGCLIAWNGAPASAQTHFDLAGTVTDNTGAVVPGATVTLRNLDTGLVRASVTDERGKYNFATVPPTGRWTLTAELSGFQTQNREGLEFQANTMPQINLQLGVGGLQESMTVTAGAPLVRTRESELLGDPRCKQMLTRSADDDGRNFLSLLQTSGSVVPTGSGSGTCSVNGQGTRMANFVADGVSMTGREIRTLNGEFGGGNGLSLDVIKELQVITNGFKAETGQTGAGTISVVTKSGTNTLAGSVYGFWRPTEPGRRQPADRRRRRRRSGSSAAARSAARSRRTTRTSSPTTKSTRHRRCGRSSRRCWRRERSRRRSGSKQGFFKRQPSLQRRTTCSTRATASTATGRRTQGVGGLNTFDRRTNTERQTDTFVSVARQQLRLEQGERGALPLHLRRRRLLFTADRATAAPRRARPTSRNAPVTVTYTGVGNLGHQPGVPAEPGREARAVGRPLLGRARARTS